MYSLVASRRCATPHSVGGVRVPHVTSVRHADDDTYTSSTRAMDAKSPSLQGPHVLSALLPLARWLHLVGFAVAAGSAIAVTLLRRQTGSERALADVLSMIEIPGLVL